VPDKARPSSLAKGEEKELAWPNAGVEDIASKKGGLAEVEEAKLLLDERAEAPRMEGWAKVGWEESQNRQTAESW